MNRIEKRIMRDNNPEIVSYMRQVIDRMIKLEEKCDALHQQQLEIIKHYYGVNRG